MKRIGFLLAAVTLIIGCGGTQCGPGEQSARVLRARPDGKAYEENICVKTYKPSPTHDPRTETPKS